MDYIYQEFCQDIEHLRSILKLTESIKTFIATNNDPKVEMTEHKYLTAAEDLHSKSRAANVGMAFIPGTLVLYLGGRFEYFIKTIFEELSLSIAVKCQKFENLPKDFQENLIIQTSEVIKSPRKYGHAENGRNTFIKNLANNINGMTITDINTKCLSITSENMRPLILADLFSRIGVKDIWVKVGQQAKVQAFFETGEASKAQTDATKFLNDFMELRNKVAHPSGSFQWPDGNAVLKHIDFFEMLGKAILELCSLYETTLTKAAVEKLAMSVIAT